MFLDFDNAAQRREVARECLFDLSLLVPDLIKIIDAYLFEPYEDAFLLDELFGSDCAGIIRSYSPPPHLPSVNVPMFSSLTHYPSYVCPVSRAMSTHRFPAVWDLTSRLRVAIEGLKPPSKGQLSLQSIASTAFRHSLDPCSRECKFSSHLEMDESSSPFLHRATAPALLFFTFNYLFAEGYHRINGISVKPPTNGTEFLDPAQLLTLRFGVVDYDLAGFIIFREGKSRSVSGHYVAVVAVDDRFYLYDDLNGEYGPPSRFPLECGLKEDDKCLIAGALYLRLGS